MVAPYEDRLAIATPEGVAVELVLAGVGSRAAARLLDSLLQLVAVVVAVVLIAVAEASGPAVAVGLVLLFATMFLYDPVFEALGSGRSPGKRWTGLRVVRLDGGPVGWGSAAVRGALRIVDLLPGTYLVGLVSVLATQRNQRVGDLVAGTIVVRERTDGVVSLDRLAQEPPATGYATARWDLSAVSDDEVAVVRSFLQRRDAITPAARYSIAVDLERRLRPRAVGAPASLAPERLLEEIVAQRSR